MKPGSEPTKGKGALVAMLAGAPSAPDSDLPGTLDNEPETDHGFRAVAKAFGIPPEREAAAQAALHQYIKTCTSEPDTDDLSGEGY